MHSKNGTGVKTGANTTGTLKHVTDTITQGSLASLPGQVRSSGRGFLA